MSEKKIKVLNGYSELGKASKYLHLPMKFEIIKTTTNRTIRLGGLTTNLTKDYSEKAFTGNSWFPIRRCFGSAEKTTVKAFLFGDFMPTRNEQGQFVKGTTSVEVFEGYGVWFDRKGYACICLNGKDVKLHIYIWERANGKKPKGYDIHHIDHNKANYNLSNLELLSHSDHQKTHAGWIKENGEWIRKPCKDCKQLLPLDAFYPRKGMTPSNRCIECSRAYSKQQNIEQGKTPKRYILPNALGQYQCSRCKNWKEPQLFKSRKNKIDSYCKCCFNQMQKDWRLKRI